MYNQVSIVRHHLYRAIEYGADFREMCRRLKLTPEMLSDGEAHMSYQPGEEHDFWTHALELTGDPCLGLHMGQKSDRYNVFGMLGMLAGSSRTVGEAMEMVSRYNDTLTGMFKYSLDRSGNEGVFEMTPASLWEETNPESARQAVDLSISAWITTLHEIGARKVYPIRTELKYAKRFEEEYRKIVKGPVLFRMPVNRFLFRKEDLDTPLVNYDQSLLIAFESLLREKQKQLESRKTLSARIRHILLSAFHGQITHIDLVASALFMTTRTLQRKLAEENTTYRAICNDLRRDLAHGLIKAGKNNKSQIADILGYTDASSFSKALRGWESTV